MEELLNKMSALEIELGNTRQQIRDLLEPFRVSDSEYRNGDVVVSVHHGYDEHDWNMGSKFGHANGYVYSYYPTLWAMLHGTFVPFEETGTEDDVYEGDWANEGYDMN